MNDELVPLSLISVMVPQGKKIISDFVNFPKRTNMCLGGPSDISMKVHIEVLGDYIIAKIKVDEE